MATGVSFAACAASQAPAYRDSMTFGVSGRDGLALEFYGGGDLIAAGLPGHRRMANRLVCSTRDSAPLAVWTAAGGHRSVGARQVPAGPGTDGLRCAGP